MQEIWKPIKGFDGRYEVSNYGRVRSYARNLTTKKVPYAISQSMTRRGYKHVLLMKGGKCLYPNVHRLVAETFVPNPENKPEVNHIDGDPTNNTVENLEWVTRSENHLHRVYALKSNPLKRCRPVQCVETGEVFPSVRAAAREYNCDHKNIQRAVSGRYETACKLHWRYA